MNDPTQRTLLLVDDEEDLREVLTDVLAVEGYRVVTAASGGEALSLRASVQPELVILDLMLPDLSGFEVCKKIKSQVTGHLPVIILTARADLDSLVDGLVDAGADDYVVKPFRHRELLARIRACLRVKDLHDVVQRQNILLAELSDTDDLTGLFNRRYLTRKLNEEILRLRSAGGVLSCALLDLDHFKHVNDAYGHLAGDEILRKFGAILKASLGPGGISGRWGGDEFFVIFSEGKSGPAGEALIRDWSNHILSLVEKNLFDPKNIRELAGAGENLKPVGVSAGVAVVKGPDPNLDPVHLIADLDKLLYQAKQNGKSHFVFAKFDSVGRRKSAAPEPHKKPKDRRPVIFVLEDDPDLCSIIRDMLSRHPVDARIFQETPKMMDAVTSAAPDLIFLDMKLADGNGMDVCRDLRKNPALARTKICFLSGFTSEEIQKKAMACGANAFMVKPFGYSKFIEQVKRLLEN